MRGNPNPRAASVHPFHRSGAIIENLHPEGWKAGEQQAGQGEDGEHVQEPGLDQPSSSAGEPSGAPISGIWRDQLLAEIEVLAGALKEKVARYSALRAAQFSDQAGELADETAVVWIQEALEDIAATALGIEIASRELFLQAASAENTE